MNKWLSIIQDWLYPPTCLLCGDPGHSGRDLCLPCSQAMPLNRPACRRCGLGLAVETARLCGRCLKKPPACDSTLALFRYEEPVRHLVHALKFRGNYAVARLFGQLMCDALTGQELPECLIPVPLHRNRYRERGFNQATEIARIVADELGISLALDCCVRQRATQPQSELPARQRLRNLHNAFGVIKPVHANHVAILDDIVTTGATTNELAKALRARGVRRIDVWACARA